MGLKGSKCCFGFLLKKKSSRDLLFIELCETFNIKDLCEPETVQCLQPIRGYLIKEILKEQKLLEGAGKLLLVTKHKKTLSSIKKLIETSDNKLDGLWEILAEVDTALQRINNKPGVTNIHTSPEATPVSVYNVKEDEESGMTVESKESRYDQDLLVPQEPTSEPVPFTLPNSPKQREATRLIDALENVRLKMAELSEPETLSYQDIEEEDKYKSFYIFIEDNGLHSYYFNTYRSRTPRLSNETLSSSEEDEYMSPLAKIPGIDIHPPLPVFNPLEDEATALRELIDRIAQITLQDDGLHLHHFNTYQSSTPTLSNETLSTMSPLVKIPGMDSHPPSPVFDPLEDEATALRELITVFSKLNLQDDFRMVPDNRPSMEVDEDLSPMSWSPVECRTWKPKEINIVKLTDPGAAALLERRDSVEDMEIEITEPTDPGAAALPERRDSVEDMEIEITKPTDPGAAALPERRDSVEDMEIEITEPTDPGAAALPERSNRPVQMMVLLPMECFRLLSLLGQGVFGKVYLAEHKFTMKRYAVKAVKKELALANKCTKQLMREKKILQMVTGHPFVVSLHAAFQTVDHLIFIMEYVDGGDFRSVLKESYMLCKESAAFYAACILLGLRHLHEKKIIHRDLKPENVLVDGRGYLKVADFGFSIDNMDFFHFTGSGCGTTAYMAPEILQYLPYNRSVDYWAFGVMIYEMLAGKRPFIAGTTLILREIIVKYEPNYPCYLSHDAIHLIKQLLQKNHCFRLGFKNRRDTVILEHPFFRTINFKDLVERRVIPPPRTFVTANPCTGHRMGDLQLSPILWPLNQNQQRAFKDFDYKGDLF